MSSPFVTRLAVVQALGAPLGFVALDEPTKQPARYYNCPFLAWAT